MDVDLYTPVTSDCGKGNNRFTGKSNKIDLKKMSPIDEASAEKGAEVSDEIDADQDWGGQLSGTKAAHPSPVDTNTLAALRAS